MFIYVNKEKNTNNSNNLFLFLKENLGNGVNISEYKGNITVKRLNKKDIKISKIKNNGYNISYGTIDYGIFKDYNAILKKIFIEVTGINTYINYEGKNREYYNGDSNDDINYKTPFFKIPEDDYFGMKLKTKLEYIKDGLSKKEIIDIYNTELNYREVNIKNNYCFLNTNNLFFLGSDGIIKFNFINELNSISKDIFPEVNIHNIFRYFLYKRKNTLSKERIGNIKNFKFVNLPIFFPDGVELISFIWGNLKICIVKNKNEFEVLFSHKEIPLKIIKKEQGFKFIITAIQYIKDFYIRHFYIKIIPGGDINKIKFDKNDKIDTILIMLVGEYKVLFSQKQIIPFEMFNNDNKKITSGNDISEKGNQKVIPKNYKLEQLIDTKLSKFLPISINNTELTCLFDDANTLSVFKEDLNRNILSFGKIGEKKDILLLGENNSDNKYVLFKDGIELYRDRYLHNVFDFSRGTG